MRAGPRRLLRGGADHDPLVARAVPSTRPVRSRASLFPHERRTLPLAPEPPITRRRTITLLVGAVGLALVASPALGGITPVINAVTPSSGTTAGGTVVSITGSYVGNCGGQPTVAFGGVLATQVQSISASEVRATTPAFGTPGPVTVSVVCFMPGSRANAFTYVAPPPDPTPEPDPDPDPAASPNPAPTPTSTSTPAPGSAVPAPSISGMTPGGASASGGQVVVVTGAHLTGASAVAFSGPAGAVAARSFGVQSDDRLSVTVPALAAGAWTVSVTTPGGVASRTGFLVVAQPAAVAGGRVPEAGMTGGAGSGTFSVWLRVGAGVGSIGPRPRYTLGGVATARGTAALPGTVCTRSGVTGTPPRVRITCPVSPALRLALADGSAQVSIRMTARVRGSSAVIPLRPVPVVVRAPVRRLAVTG